jgi:hypothetical protein
MRLDRPPHDASARDRAAAYARLLAGLLIALNAAALAIWPPLLALMGAAPGPLRLAFGAFVSGFVLAAASAWLQHLAEAGAAGALFRLGPHAAGFLAVLAFALGCGAVAAALTPEAAWPS